MEVSLFYNNVTVIDYAYYDKSLGFVGHSLIVNARFLGKKNEEGILYDFSYAKKKVKEIIDRECDHRLVVPEGIVSKEDECFYLKCSVSDKTIEYMCPPQGICEIQADQVTSETLKNFLQEIVMKEMPENILSVEFDLLEELNSENLNYLSYTHGLKNHHGNCQRLLHGHRSTFKIFVDNERMHKWEDQFLKEIFFSRPIHFAFWENVINRDEVTKVLEKGAIPEIVHVGYESPQGRFSVKLPGEMVYFLDDETTVENLTIHFAKKIKEMFKNEKIEFHMFEGVGKGAIVKSL